MFIFFRLEHLGVRWSKEDDSDFKGAATWSGEALSKMMPSYNTNAPEGYAETLRFFFFLFRVSDMNSNIYSEEGAACFPEQEKEK